MTSQHADGGGPATQDALFGDPAPLPAAPASPAPGINDLDLVASVIRSAQDPGYVVVGPSERVLLRDPTGWPKGTVERVPTYEQDTVRQFLADGLLTLGGVHRVHYGDRDGPAHSVLVPKATRTMATRWAQLHPLDGVPYQRTGRAHP